MQSVYLFVMNDILYCINLEHTEFFIPFEASARHTITMTRHVKNQNQSFKLFDILVTDLQTRNKLSFRIFLTSTQNYNTQKFTTQQIFYESSRLVQVLNSQEASLHLHLQIVLSTVLDGESFSGRTVRGDSSLRRELTWFEQALLWRSVPLLPFFFWAFGEPLSCLSFQQSTILQFLLPL